MLNNIINNNTIIFGTGNTAPWNSPNVEQKIFRTKFSAHGGRRRHKNGSFGTEFFRRIRPERPRSPEIPKKRKTWNPTGVIPPFITVIIPWFSKIKNPKNWAKLRLQGEVRDGIGTVWKVTVKRRVSKGRNWPPTAKKLEITTTTDFFPTFFPQKLLPLILLL